MYIKENEINAFIDLMNNFDFGYKNLSEDARKLILDCDVALLHLLKRRNAYNKKQKEEMRKRRAIDKNYGRKKKDVE